MCASLNRGFGLWQARFWLIVKKIFHRSGFPRLRSLAGWRNLLEDLNLDKIKFDTRIRSTDYLPIDIQAAPAYATVDVITILAFVAGCQSLDLSTNFPSHEAPIPN